MLKLYFVRLVSPVEYAVSWWATAMTVVGNLRQLGAPAVLIISGGLALVLYTVYACEPGWMFPLTIAMVGIPYAMYGVLMLVIRGRNSRWYLAYSLAIGLGLIASHVGILWAYLLGRGQSSTDGLVLGLGAFAQVFIVIPALWLFVLIVQTIVQSRRTQ